MIEKEDHLEKSVANENEFFTSILDFIPPEHYGYDEDVKELLRDRKHALVDGKLKPAERSKLSNKLKGRLARLDDRQCHTNSQIASFLLASRQSSGKDKKRKHPAEELDEQDSSRASKKRQRTEKRTTPSNKPALINGSNSADRQELLGKLQTKLDELRAKRGVPADATKGLDWQEKKRLKRKLSKAKLKERRRHERGQTNGRDDDKGASVTPKASISSPSTTMKALANTSTPKNQSQLEAASILSKKQGGPKNPIQTSSTRKPALVDKDGTVVFSKFDFAVPGVIADESKSKWSKKNAGKDYKRLLEKQTKFQEKVQKLEDQENVEGAKKLKEKAQWDAAAERARGGKVKDDINLLKKNLKRKEKRKEHSKKKWDARNETLQHKQEEKQKKRRENIQAKRKEKKDKKIAKARKKGRLI